MPAKSAKQQRFMAAVANNPQFAKKVGVPQNVGEEFMKKGYKAGGMPMVRGKDGKMVPEFAADGKGKMMAGGKVKKYQMGGMADMSEDMPMKRKKKRSMDDMMAVMGTGAGAPRRGMKSGGKVRGCGMARGGAVRQCKMVKMKGA
jgi:hypothetical protein